MASIDLGQVVPTITNNLETTTTGAALDAAQGPIIVELIDDVEKEASLKTGKINTYNGGLGSIVYASNEDTTSSDSHVLNTEGHSFIEFIVSFANTSGIGTCYLEINSSTGASADAVAGLALGGVGTIRVTCLRTNYASAGNYWAIFFEVCSETGGTTRQSAKVANFGQKEINTMRIHLSNGTYQFRAPIAITRIV